MIVCDRCESFAKACSCVIVLQRCSVCQVQSYFSGDALMKVHSIVERFECRLIMILLQNHVQIEPFSVRLWSCSLNFSLCYQKCCTSYSLHCFALCLLGFYQWVSICAGVDYIHLGPKSDTLIIATWWKCPRWAVNLPMSPAKSHYIHTNMTFWPWADPLGTAAPYRDLHDRLTLTVCMPSNWVTWC